MLLQQLLRPIHIDLRISLAHVNKIVVLRPIMAFQQFEDDFLTIVSVCLLLGFEYQLFMSKLLLLFLVIRFFPFSVIRIPTFLIHILLIFIIRVFLGPQRLLISDMLLV